MLICCPERKTTHLFSLQFQKHNYNRDNSIIRLHNTFLPDLCLLVKVNRQRVIELTGNAPNITFIRNVV